MRIVPLCIWMHRLPIEDVVKAVKLETLFTHCSPIVMEASITYALSLIELIKSACIDSALITAKSYLESSSSDDPTSPKSIVLSWLTEALSSHKTINAKVNFGWIKIAFV